MPYFSIVIPMFNRESLIRRALDSCLQQSFTDYEVIVVDDASTDDSAGIVETYTDPRVRLVRHAENRGVCPARNTGIRFAVTDWIILLDSDDELLPDALACMHQRTQEVAADVARLVFMYRRDDGRLSPEPPLTDDILDYEGYLRVFEQITGLQDVLNCTRRSTFDEVPFPEDRSNEGQYHLTFMQRFRERTCPDIVAVIHTDAANRITVSSVDRLLRDACDNARGITNILTYHGDAIRKHAPSAYSSLILHAANQHFLCNDRGTGLRYSRHYLQAHPVSPLGWFVLVCGLAGPSALAQAITIKSRVRRYLGHLISTRKIS